MTSLLLALLLTQTPPKTWAKPGSDAPYVQSIQGVTGMTPLAISGTITSSGAGDTVGASATYNANSVCGFVATAGQAGAGFFVAAGTLAATLTPSVSTDSSDGVSGTWTATSFLDISSNASATLVLTNPNSAQAYGIKLMGGARYARVCTTSYTSGSAVGHLTATTSQPPPPAAGADVTDRAGRLVGVVSGTVTTTPPSNASTNVAQVAGTATDVNSGVKSAGTMRVVLATDQPQLTNKLLVTPDSVALPANQSTNVAQVAGTTTDTNSGVKSAGTLRVVLATDQPALTNKLLVTPDSVALPANQSVNVAQLAGTATDVNSGVKSAGTLRVVLATDQPALTNKLLVTPDSVALPANQSVNVAQINGVATTMGNGVSGTGVQRVTLASDSTGQVALATGANTIGALTANQSTNVNQINSVTPLMGNGVTGTGSQRVTIASDNTAFSVNAAQATAANLNARTDTSGATGAAPPARADFVGGLASGATGGFVVGVPVCDTFVNINVATATTTLLVTGVSGRHVRICSMNVVAAAADNVALISGTGATCGTLTTGMNGGTTAATGWNLAAGGGITQGGGIGSVNQTNATGDSVCIVTSAATQLSGRIAYTIY